MEKSVYEVVCSRRSIRRFSQKKIEINVLEQMIDAARVAPSAANLQPLEYVLVTSKERCEQLFPTIGWAGYITPKWIPDLKERPTAYIVICVQQNLMKYYKWDVGLAAENIMLVAEAEDIGSCLLLNIDREAIRTLLAIPSSLYVDAIVALGYKSETAIIEEMTDSVKYYRDENEVLHVPKRNLQDILHINHY